MRLPQYLPLAVTLFAAAVLSGCPPLLSPGVLRTQNLVYGKGNVQENDGGPYTRVDLHYDLIEK